MAGEMIDIVVEYQWKPIRCSKCEVFGHVCRTEPREELGLSTVQETNTRGMRVAVEQGHIEKEDFTVIQGRKNRRDEKNVDRMGGSEILSTVKEKDNAAGKGRNTEERPGHEASTQGNGERTRVMDSPVNKNTQEPNKCKQGSRLGMTYRTIPYHTVPKP